LTLKKNSLLRITSGISLALLASMAHAQGSVTLYGIADTGMEYLTHAGPTGKSVLRIPSVTGVLGSRWGLKGTENLGNGLSAIFRLESGFNLNNGASGQGGRLFGRQAFVGLKSDKYGQLTFGHQYSMTLQMLYTADLVGAAIYSMGSIDGYLSSARSDNMVVYMNKMSLGNYGAMTVGASYSFGRETQTGTPGEGTCAGGTWMIQCQGWSAMLQYDAAQWGVGASYDLQRGGGANSAANLFNGLAPVSMNSPHDKSARTLLYGYFKGDAWKVSTGFLGRSVSRVEGASVRSNMYFLQGSYYVTPYFQLMGAVLRAINSQQDTRATMGIARGTYFLSKSTNVYLQAAYMGNSKNAAYTVSGGGGTIQPPTGQGQFGAMVGIQHQF